MKKLSIFLKTLLVAVGIGVGSNGAWAYTVPTGYEIKSVIVGTAVMSGDVITSVTADGFESYSSLPSGWTAGELTSITLDNKDNVANVDEGSTVSGTGSLAPTYVGGKVIKGYLSYPKGADYDYSIRWSGTYSFSTVTDGHMILSADLCGNGNHPAALRIVDSANNNILTIAEESGKNTGDQSFYYKVGSGTHQVNIATSKNRNYPGWSIEYLDIDIIAGKANLKLDYINNSGVRSTVTKTIDLGSVSNVAGIQLGAFVGSTSGKGTVDVYLDNLSIYKVGVSSSATTYTVYAKNGNTVIKTLASDIANNGDNYTVYLPRFIEANGSFYEWSEYTNETTDFSKTYTMGAQSETRNVEYSPREDIVSLYEIGRGSTATYSAGGSGETTNKMAIVNLSEGVYTAYIKVVGKGGSGSNYRQEGLYVGDELQTSTDGTTGLKELDFSITGNNVNVYVRGKGSSSYSDILDYVYIAKRAVTYTVKYMCGSTEVKASDATRTAVWGTHVTLTDDDKANVPGTSKYYQYVSDDAASQEISADGSTVITVYFKQVDEAYKWDFTGLTDDAFIDVDQTESIRENSIDCYNTTLSVANGLYFQPSSSGGVTSSAWKCYRKTDSTPGLRNISSGDRQCIIPNLLAGDKIVISGNADAINGISSAKYEGTKDTDNNTYTVTMTADGNYYFKLAKVNSSSTPAVYPDIKSIVVYRELTEITAPIVSTTGYATLSSTYALDFTGIETLTAYKATTCDGTSVTLEPVTGTVAPNTGLVIKGVTTNIPVVATGDAQDGNLLQPCDGSWTTLKKSDTGTNYVLSEQGDPKVAVFAPIINTPATLRAGIAYLYVPSGSGSSRTLNIVFADDEATAVFDLNDKSEMTNDKWYDLQGRRVTQPTKGLYIVNGRKVVVK